MSSGYRDDLAAAQARIAELEASMAGGPDLVALEREHAARVRSVPTRTRVRVMTAVATCIALLGVVSMLLPSAYDRYPRFTFAMQMLMIAGAAVSAATLWVSRVTGLRAVALSERLLASERARVALESRVRVGEPSRIASEEPLEEVEAASARKTTEPRR